MATCPKCGTRYASNVRICTHDGTVLSDEPIADSRIGRLLDGKYRLDAYLSQGGMGAVYKATHVMLDKTVVVKLIKPELVTSAEIVRRFQREARAASNLNHPNIVGVYDLGQTDDGTLYIAMEYIDGPSLKDVIRKSGPMPVPRIKSILGQVSSALALAHRHNIIHRDLKPHNVMLAKGPDGQEIAKLLDFGIAKTFEDDSTQLTQTGFAIGTPQYMAPEQAAGKEVTPQSDLYSLGVMLYEMLVGEVPFDAPTTAAILIKQLTETPEPPSRRKPELGISQVLEAITMRCLDKEPTRRFSSAETFAAALTAADGDETQRRVSEASTLGMPVPSRAATTVGAPAAPAPAPQPTAQTHVVPPPPMAPAQVAPPPAPTVMPPPAAPAAAVAPTPAPAVAAAPPPPVAAPSSDGTRPTVPGSAMPAAAVPPSSSSRMGLWITLGAVAVLVLAVAASQLGLVPGQNTNATQQPQSAPAPQASPASADAPASAPPTAPPAPAAPAAPAPAATTPTTPAEPPLAEAAAPPSAPAQTRTPAAAASGNLRPSAGPAAAAAKSTAALAGSANAAATPRGTIPAAAPAAAGTPAAAPAPSAGSSRAVAQAARPENPTVFLRCEGVPAVCNALRASLLEQFQKHDIQPMREPARAAIVLTANVEIVQDRVSREFGTPMQTRTYTVDVSGETKDGSPVSMPPPKTFSFDAQFGRERLEENVRVLASDVTDKIKAFWSK